MIHFNFEKQLVTDVQKDSFEDEELNRSPGPLPIST